MGSRGRRREEAGVRRELERGEQLELAFRARTKGALSLAEVVEALIGWWFPAPDSSCPYVVALTDRRLIVCAVRPWTRRLRVESACARADASIETFELPKSWSGRGQAAFAVNTPDSTRTLYVRVGSRDEASMRALSGEIRSHHQHLRPELL